ncbi:STAS domain-containing protein [Lentzea sp. DG1S-22]|uniref:STAS domain-containing protein n=1 Tax=Lentzea sp. DG1S-22 TaxID=3108822 RepID=UPI002E773126|nr:STAS domain-containing protein [Lentzea sp. DG1S-22]WVH83284.1 STAS domain-containing protein [Lentzea sp. DG1S-22]
MTEEAFEHDEFASVRVATIDAAVVVRIAGEVDAFTEAAVRAPLFEALDATPPVVVVDLEEVSFIGSTGLRVLVEACEQARRDGVDLRVVVNTRPLQRLLEVSGLDGHLPVAGSLHDALVSAGSAAKAG